MVGRNETIWTAIDSISRLIMHDLIALAGEQRHPGGGGPDAMDDFIKDKKESVTVLRRIRNEFEDITSGAIIREAK